MSKRKFVLVAQHNKPEMNNEPAYQSSNTQRQNGKVPELSDRRILRHFHWRDVGVSSMNMVEIIMALFKKEAEPTPEILLGMEGLRARNEARMAEIKEKMGPKYLLHPDNKQQRLETPRN